MTRQQINWAKKHDWFLRFGPLHNGGFYVVARDDMNATKTVIFDNFKALKEWAGY